MTRWSRRTIHLSSLLITAFFFINGIVIPPIEGVDQQLQAAQNDPGMVAGKPDVQGATQAGTEFQRQTPGGQPPGPTSGAAGGGLPIEQPGLKPPPGAEFPTAGAGGPVGPGPGQGVWCYSEKTYEQYWFPYGPCPSPYVKPPTAGGPPHDPRVPWQELVPPSVGGGPKPSTHPKPACGPTTVCTCPGGKVGHIPCDKSKGSCHCGGG